MQEARVRSLGWEDPLEKEIATHSSTLAWKIPWMEDLGRLQSMGSQRDMTEQLRFPFSFLCHKGGVICISEVIDISHSSLDSSFC